MMLFLDKLAYFVHWCNIHEISSIHSNINSEFPMGTQITSTHLASIFDVVNHQGAIMNNFRESTAKINIFVFLKLC